MTLFVDLETFSATDIKAGVYKYSADPLFEILMCAWAYDDEPVQVAIGEEAIREIPGLFDSSVLKVAHNCQFDRICLSVLHGEYLDPEAWDDTMALAGEWGYPQSLANLAKALKVEAKDSAGTRLINTFAKPQRGKRIRPEDKPEHWQQFVDYCRQDVVVLREVHRALPDWPTPMERQVYLTDQRINDYGLKVDLELAAAAVAAATANRANQCAEITELTGVVNPNSVTQLLAWCQDHGYGRPDLTKENVEHQLRGVTGDLKRVLELRQELALVASKKFSTALANTSDDGRLRGGFKFHGAHTGRWTGRGLQWQNLASETFIKDDELDLVAQAAVITDLKLGLGATALDLKKLVRPMFVGPFSVVDYASIEARVLAWLAGESWALDAFATGRDIYVETAERMGGLTRFQGKVAVLALGFGGGVGALRRMAGDALGTDDQLQRMVYQWRDANPRIRRFWKVLEQRFVSGGRVGAHLRVKVDGSTRRIILPSGRGLSYHGVTMRNGRISFSDPKGFRNETYGGKLTENVTQAVARDILAEALVRLEAAGHQVVAHVHDEVICESLDVDEVAKVMCVVPEWAEGLPLDAEGHVLERYQKLL